ncbi:MAG: complex subunit Pcc1 [Candidatus Methanomethylophilaceae archaeon]|nr:complex subunit Pcc1 [Candidatus Methanomethylophilaceae archaeon]MDI3541699.1 complex subunit Pcc1 [Candidatus Methanomethylophilaceae archaeon]HIJ00391.1 hypothetical protein [Candidatus Methanomethylophilaceae archaeon]
MLTATLRMAFDDNESVLRSLSPEMGREVPRSRVDGRVDGNELMLEFEAEDISALRAALNSYIGWIKITEDINSLVGKRNERH